MGAGKTCIGSRLAERLRLPFVDADVEIERAAGCSITDIFELYGEREFRLGERRVIKRLLKQPAQVLATGGGAFMDADTRKSVKRTATSVWLRADLELLVSRTSRRGDRPLLDGKDHRKALRKLILDRHPFYKQADLVVDSGTEPPIVTVEKIMEALKQNQPKKPRQ